MISSQNDTQACVRTLSSPTGLWMFFPTLPSAEALGYPLPHLRRCIAAATRFLLPPPAWKSGSNASREPCSTLSRLLHQRQRDVALLHHIARDLELAHAFLAGQVVHEVEHQLFQDHAQTAGADLA